jgi:hypothetical protein
MRHEFLVLLLSIIIIIYSVSELQIGSPLQSVVLELSEQELLDLGDDGIETGVIGSRA